MTEQLISLSPHSSSIRERYQHTSAIKGLELREAREGTEMYGVELDIGADSSWNNNNHNHNGSGQGQGQGNSVNDMKTVDMNNMGIYTNENANANGDVSQDQVLQSIDHLTMNDGESAHINRGLPGYMRSDQETVIRSDGGLK